MRASGEVLYRGQPLANAVVTFTNAEAGQSASGTTDGIGRFELTTFDNGDGAVPGTQKVSVNKTEVDYPGTKLTGMSAAEINAAIAKMTQAEVDSLPPTRARSLIPDRYASPQTSKLTAEVTEGGENHFRFELQD